MTSLLTTMLSTAQQMVARKRAQMILINTAKLVALVLSA
jgi:hypothetical protein